MSEFNAADYKQKIEAKKQAKTYNVKMPSGVMFTLRKPSLTVFFSSGKLPQSYIEKLMSFEQKNLDEVLDVYRDFTPEEKAADTHFLGLVVRAACVTPKIVENPKAADELEFSDIDDEDLIKIFQWAISHEGSVDGENAAKFRRKR